MSIKLCFVYPWATLGGVERVLLNRLIAISNAHLPIEIDLMFLHDSGGVKPLRDILAKNGIKARIIVATDFSCDAKYDLVFCIDCPQVFELCARRKFRFIAECHTSYEKNRKYLQHLPAACELVVTPSRLFSNRIKNEIDKNSSLEVVELRNFVPWDTPHDLGTFNLPDWSIRPILFMGRMDMHKDPVALLDAFSNLERVQPGRFFCMFCGPQSPEVNISKEIRNRNLLSKVLVLPPLPFGSTSILLDMIKRKGGIFVSPSKGESFGLSAAEAISAGLPVMLSDIEEHRALVPGHEDKFIYRLGDSKSLSTGISYLFDHYESASSAAIQVREKLSSRVFLEDWSNLLVKLNLQ